MTHPLQIERIGAITLDLDDTLWPFLPAVERAEQVLHQWLLVHAPRTSGFVTSPSVLRAHRADVERDRPDLAHDLGGLRLESIRRILVQAGEDPGRSTEAYEVFFAERQRVTLFDDVLPALDRLSARFPLVAVTNGNADLARVGLSRFFRGSFSAASFGKAKPHADIFHAAAASVGVEPADVLHVGDDPLLDVSGALAAGMQAAWIVRAGDGAMPAWAHGHPPPHATLPDLLALCDALEPAGSV